MFSKVDPAAQKVEGELNASLEKRVSCKFPPRLDKVHQTF